MNTPKNMMYAVAISLAAMYSCNDSTQSPKTRYEEHKDSLQRDLEAATKDVTIAYTESKETVKQHLKHLGDEVDTSIEEINTELKVANSDAKNKLNAAKDDLVKERENINKALQDVEESSENTWSDVKVKSEKTYEEVTSSFNKTKEDVKEYLNKKF